MTRPGLIATDLDGTFLRPDGSVSDLNAAAVAAAARAGIPFVIATGRPRRWLGVLDALHDAHPQVIVSNGGAIVDLARRTVLQEFPLRTDTMLAVIEDLRSSIPGITFGFETGTGFGCEPSAPAKQRSEPGQLSGSPTELLTELGPVIKVLGFHPQWGSEALTERASQVIGEKLNVTHASVSQPYGMIELTAPGISKASTLAHLCADLGIDAHNVVAFGDMPNDAEMLSWAGQGYVVANGHASMKDCGFIEVAANVEDGVGATVLALLG